MRAEAIKSIFELGAVAGFGGMSAAPRLLSAQGIQPGVAEEIRERDIADLQVPDGGVVCVRGRKPAQLRNDGRGRNEVFGGAATGSGCRIGLKSSQQAPAPRR